MFNKKGWIRSDNMADKKCPFGLPITNGCKCAGSSVFNMVNIESVPEDKKEKIKTMNKRILVFYGGQQKCVFANNIMEKYGSVNCNFDDTAAGMGEFPTIEGSPLYTQTFGGMGLDGLHAAPIGFYADNLVSRNLFEGLFSLVSRLTKKLPFFKSS
jgi:hypothetical protein